MCNHTEGREGERRGMITYIRQVTRGEKVREKVWEKVREGLREGNREAKG